MTKKNISRSIFLILFVLFGIALSAEPVHTDSTDTKKANSDFSFIPQIHGVLRGRWDLETTSGFSRFMVRNARVSVDGKVAPIVSYMVNIDFCDRGKVLPLDVYATLGPVKDFRFLVGQYRMPFGVESFRGPANQLFNNRSFIGKHVNNYRAVGVSAGYTLPKAPFTIEAGVFNPTTIDDHTRWVKKYAYAGKMTYKPSGWIVSAGFESIIPDSVRINLASATLGWGTGNFYVEGEYMIRAYTHKTHKTTQAYNFFANYELPLRKGLFNTLSFQARFDGMTDLASGTDPVGPDGKLATTQHGRRRLTIGSTLDYQYKTFRAALRVNFEKYWYDHSVRPNRGDDDILSAELIIKF